MTELIFLLVALAGVLGGALGAYIAKRESWKGAVAAFAGYAASTVADYIIPPDGYGWAVWLAFLLGLGLAGRALGLSGREMSSVVIGSFLVTIAVVALLALLGVPIEI